MIATCEVFRRYRARTSLVSIGITRSNDPLITAEQFLLHCRRSVVENTHFLIFTAITGLGLTRLSLFSVLPAPLGSPS
jgi:hypothetical protein